MHDCDQPAPADCARCPLRLPLPDELDDAALAHLVEGLYLFATALENGCYSRLRRYYAAQREHHRLPEQSHSSADSYQDPSDDDLPF